MAALTREERSEREMQRRIDRREARDYRAFQRDRMREAVAERRNAAPPTTFVSLDALQAAAGWSTLDRDISGFFYAQTNPTVGLSGIGCRPN